MLYTLNDNIMVENLLFWKIITESAKDRYLFEILEKFITEDDCDLEKLLMFVLMVFDQYLAGMAEYKRLVVRKHRVIVYISNILK